MVEAHVSSWLHCLSALAYLEHAIGPHARDKLAGLIDPPPPPSYGGIGVQSLERSADEEFLGSFARISASLILLCRSTELPVYIAIAEALEGMDNASELLSGGEDAPPTSSILQVKEVAVKTLVFPPSYDLIYLFHFEVSCKFEFNSICIKFTLKNEY